jgi:cytochrome c oxidase assembly protein subunit 15
MLNLLDNRITIHFIHRGLAYILVALIIWMTIKMFKAPSTTLARKARFWPMILVLFQVIVGIYAVLESLEIVPNQWGRFEWLAQAHQVIAMLLFLSLLLIIFIYRKRAALP